MKFQVQLANKEFLNELKAMIGPKLNPPLVIQETVLSLIEDWSGMFKHGHEFKSIEHFCNELKTKGIEFPKRTESKNDDLQSREDFNKIPSSTTAMARKLKGALFIFLIEITIGLMIRSLGKYKLTELSNAR